MADLKTNLLGFSMNSPIIGASGTVGYGVEYEELADFSKIGGISGKGLTLHGQYAAFGKVTSGMEVVDAIAAVKTDRNDRPQEEQKIASITVDTHGESYEAPKKLPDPYGRF